MSTKKSSYLDGCITVGYRGKKYRCQIKALKAARRRVKSGRWWIDPSVYEYRKLS